MITRGSQPDRRCERPLLLQRAPQESAGAWTGATTSRTLQAYSGGTGVPVTAVPRRSPEAVRAGSVDEAVRRTAWEMASGMASAKKCEKAWGFLADDAAPGAPKTPDKGS